MDISLILSQRYPDAQWTLDGDSYSGLTWLSDGDAPTLAELEAEWAQVEYEVAYEAVQKARQTAYQSESDPIFFDYQRGEVTEQDWLDAVQAVKDAHPYPAIVSFDANAGEGSMGAQVGTGVTALQANGFTLEGHSFDGWNTVADGSGDAFADGAEYDFSADLTLFAQWVEVSEPVEEV